jgi:L-aminopeptidase/D-esterase-like protein
MKSTLAILLAAALLPAVAAPQSPRPRARDLGVPFEGTPGPLNAITDVAGVEVGLTTIISGEGKLQVGKGPARTGVTAVLPRGRSGNPVMAGWFSLNGNGEMTGTTWVEESGFLEGPIFITNTHSVGTVHQAAIEWAAKNAKNQQSWSLPIVAETWDGMLNDINGFHVKPEHVFQAIQTARGGAVPEGNVGGGTGMICFQFKCGTGTSSRRLPSETGGYTVGVLVQANFGLRPQLLVAGAPVGRETPLAPRSGGDNELGSIIIVVATDAPLLPHQLKRLARRASLGLARTGSTAGNGSGDIFVAFSTANSGAAAAELTADVTMLANDRMNPVFNAVVQATEEAIINALVAGETMRGINDVEVLGIPHDRLREVLRKYGR